MPRIEKRMKEITLAASISLAVAIILLAYLASGWTASIDDFVFLAVMIAVFPSAVLNYIDFRWRRAIDGRLPDLFRNIVQAQETGMTLPQAMEEAAKRDYGPLTAELKKMNAQISWGMSLDDALQALSQRVDTVLMRRTAAMIIEAMRSGGHIEKVFDPMGKFIQTTLLLDKERQTQTRPYIAIIYVGYFVFILTIVLLFKSLFAGKEGLPILTTATASSIEIQRTFFHMASIQAFFGGLVAGKMSDGSISAGMKHSIALMICGYLALRLFL